MLIKRFGINMNSNPKVSIVIPVFRIVKGERRENMYYSHYRN